MQMEKLVATCERRNEFVIGFSISESRQQGCKKVPFSVLF
jgi:formate dehydrogenase assembly factor FdhD